jgi:hypothetical protein
MRCASIVLLAGVAMSSVAAPVPKKAAAPNYFPCALGTKWEYAVEGKKGVTVTLEVTDVEEKDGVRTITIDQTGGAKLPDYPERYRIDKDGVFMLSANTKDLDPPRLDLKAKPKANDEWDSPHTWNRTEYTLTVSVGDEEKVEVPAGTYTALPHAMAYGYNGVKTSWTAWFAPDVGRVKWVDYNERVYLLTKYTAGKQGK